ncbi:hypothetical protein N9X12_05520 [Alphaproteobacteria bacterium]|nr:hypothetical protein [Alphaproteobacteria bacterium]
MGINTSVALAQPAHFSLASLLISAFADYAANVNSCACQTDQYWSGQNADFNGNLTEYYLCTQLRIV